MLLPPFFTGNNTSAIYRLIQGHIPYISGNIPEKIYSMQYIPEKINISIKSAKLLRRLFQENPRLEKIYNESTTEESAGEHIKQWAWEVMGDNIDAVAYYKREKNGPENYKLLRWKDLAAIRILDYFDYAGQEFENPYMGDEKMMNNPFNFLWLAIKEGTGGSKPLFFLDMIYLFSQLSGKLVQTIPDRETIMHWMERWSHGMDPAIIRERELNRDRIISVLVETIEDCGNGAGSYAFEEGMTPAEKIERVRKWWDDYRFHLRFAIRCPTLLNELLDHSLDLDTQRLLKKAEKKGIPFFVNPYYISLLSTRTPNFTAGADLAIRHYVIYSKPLIDQFGNIKAWEKEDRVEQGKPNAAGWILPSHHNVHRRYPEVAIMIPDTMGRACGGLCVSCQRMYEFQRGNLNFNLDKLRPDETWNEKLRRLLDYYENDTQLRDILITGGDALMSRDESLEKILDSVYEMAIRKREANKNRPEGKKYAEILRIRLGTRMLAYLPQRVTASLTGILASFRKKASSAGIEQFVIQTHFESPMEVTPEAEQAVKRLVSAGWTVYNQLVFTSAASRRGHTAMLRKVLNDIGVITYYTFSVKGFLENTFNYATNARAVQEQTEEKYIGEVPVRYNAMLKDFARDPERMVSNLAELRNLAGIPFLATDRNVINLPAVGKSMTFRTIGITRWGRRIQEFDHDQNRWHSPIINKLGKIIIVESKPVGEYLNQLEDMGENIEEYQSIWGYSMGETETRFPIFEYPEFRFGVTSEITNLEI
jgi:lysine 2,3-aminomutase